SGRNQARDHLAVKVAPRRLPMQTERDAGASFPLVEIVHAQTGEARKIATIVRREGVAWKSVEANIGGSQSRDDHMRCSSSSIHASAFAPGGTHVKPLRNAFGASVAPP